MSEDSHGGAGRLGAADALAIVSIILILGGSLVALVASRDAHVLARTQQWVSELASQANPSLP